MISKPLPPPHTLNAPLQQIYIGNNWQPCIFHLTTKDTPSRSHPQPSQNKNFIHSPQVNPDTNIRKMNYCCSKLTLIISGGPNTWRFHDDVINDATSDKKVWEENQREHEHCRGSFNPCWFLQLQVRKLKNFKGGSVQTLHCWLVGDSASVCFSSFCWSEKLIIQPTVKEGNVGLYLGRTIIKSRYRRKCWEGREPIRVVVLRSSLSLSCKSS